MVGPIEAGDGLTIPQFIQKAFNDEMKMPAVDYAATIIMPDFHFHMTIAYAILRHNGVKLGKMDFLGKPG